MKYLLPLFLSLVSVMSCQVTEIDYPEEDYESLFPSKGIEKNQEYGSINRQHCDPELALANYVYPGDDAVIQQTYHYNVTLTCSFQEKDRAGKLVKDPISRYSISFINEQKELVTITSVPESAAYSHDPKPYKRMKNGYETSITFTATSGFPLYLSVNGEGTDGSSVKATMTASGVDLPVEIPVLKTEQYLNTDGYDKLTHPYCEYIVLP